MSVAPAAGQTLIGEFGGRDLVFVNAVDFMKFVSDVFLIIAVVISLAWCLNNPSPADPAHPVIRTRSDMV